MWFAPEGPCPMPMDAKEIERLIKARFPSAEVAIKDLAGDGDHYAAHVVAKEFAGKTRVQRVREALGVLTGGDDTLTGQYARFADRERITIITFSAHPEIDRTFLMTKPNDPAVFGAVRQLAAVGLIPVFLRRMRYRSRPKIMWRNPARISGGNDSIPMRIAK